MNQPPHFTTLQKAEHRFLNAAATRKLLQETSTAPVSNLGTEPIDKILWAHDIRTVTPRIPLIRRVTRNPLYSPKLREDARWRCVNGILENALNGGHRKPHNFEEWIRSIFGEGVAEEFMLPYNFKVWAFPPAKLAFDWVGERVAVTDIRRVLENLIRNRLDASWGPNNVFKFPRRGGTGAIWNSVARLIGLDKFKLNANVCRVDPSRKRVHLDSGEVIAYDNLLSTMPLDLLTTKVSGFSSQKKRYSQLLKYSTSNIVGVGLKGQPSPELEPKCWMYFPEDNCPFYRVTLFSKYSPENVPDISTQFSLMTETSESTHKPVSQATLRAETVEGLKATKLIRSEDEVLSVWSFRAEYGYPTPSLNRDEILNDVLPGLEALDIFSGGRFGAWKYEVSNQDHSFMQGVEWVDFVLNGKLEETLQVTRATACVEEDLELATA